MKRKILTTSFAMVLCASTVLTSAFASNAMEYQNDNSTEYKSVSEKLDEISEKKAEDIKVISSVEELNVNDIIVKNSDSVFRACRLIITSDDDMEFKDIKHRNNIKSVQRIDNKYIVEYASVNDTEEAYKFYTSMGVEVEIDVVNNTPEGVENKDDENQDVRNEEIVSTNETKPTESIDRVKEDKDIVVAILDSGLNASDKIFDGRIIEGKNFIDDKDTSDIYGHATVMSRIVLENTTTNEDSQVKIMPIKVLNDEGVGTTLSAYKGIKYAIEKKVDVINLSMAGIGHSKLLESAINEAYNNNIPVIVSAGNDNKEITEYTPANIESAFSISSAFNTDKGLMKESYSNYGSDTNKIDYATKGYYEYSREINNREVITSVNGTSVSSAYVTSFVALLKQMARNDEDDNNDNITIRDIDNSFSESAIKTDNEVFFGKGYLEKDNLVIKHIDNGNTIEPTPLPVEDVSDEEIEKIALFALAQERHTLAYIIDGKGYCNENGGLETIHAGQIVCNTWNQHFPTKKVNFSTMAWENQGVLLEVALWQNFITDSYQHNIVFNDQLSINDVYSQSFTIKNSNGGTNPKRIINVDTTGANGNDGIWFFKVNDTKSTPLITTSGYVTFIGGSIAYDGAQYNSNSASIQVNPNSTYKAPMINNNGNLTLDGTSLRAGGQASYVLTNNGTATLTGGGSLQGGARSNSTSSLVINNSGKTLNVNHYVLNASYLSSNANYRVGNAISNMGTCNINGSNYCAIGNANTGINNNGTCNINGSSTPLISGCQYGISNSKTMTITNANIQYNTYGINNTSSITYNGGNVQHNTYFGINNTGTIKQSKGYVSYNGYNSNNVKTSNSVGVDNKGTYELSGSGEIHNNSSYGINNTGTVNQTGGKIHTNLGAKPDTNDIVDVGVYQGGTYTVGTNAYVTNNSVYLPTTSSRLKQAGTLSGTVILTTSSSDRQIGRELVTGKSDNYAKYSLAYGNVGTKTNAKNVKDSTEEGGGAFSGNKVGIRPGSLIYGKTATSCYLSGEYNISYLPNTPKGESVSPTNRPNTTFYFRESVTALFGTNTYSATESTFKGYAKSSSATIPEYTSNYTFSGANTFTGNRVFYAVWKKNAEKYTVFYNHNNGYGDTSSQECERDTYYNYASAPTRYTSGQVIFDVNGGSNVTSVAGAYSTGLTNVFNEMKTFRGWNRAGDSTLYTNNNTFYNLGAVNSTVVMNGNWSINPITLPTSKHEDKVIVGWQIDGEGKIYPVGDIYYPTSDIPVTFVAVWETMDRTITYKPNGAVDKNGNPCQDVKVDKPAPLSAPITLLDGTYAGGTRLVSDISYTKGDVRYDLAEYVPANTSSNSIQYRAKAGDIVNNLGNTTTLSKFRGWAITPSGSNAFNGNVTLTSNSLWGDGAYSLKNFVFYAVWDEFPQLVANDIVVSSANVSRADLVKSIVASDREDGNITSKVQIINYNEVINALSTSNGFTVIYEVTDSAGNTTRAFAKISIEDEYDGKALNVITKQVRCINRHAYNTFDANEGGCLPNSPFYNDTEYANVLLSCFDNLDNNTPIARYTLTQKERQDISAHLHDVGLEKMYEKNVLQYYVDKYMDAEHQNRKNEYFDSKLFFLSISAEQMINRENQELDRLKALRNDNDLSRAYR